VVYVEKNLPVTRKHSLIVFEFGEIIITGIYNPFKLQPNQTKEEKFTSLMKALYNIAESYNSKKVIVGG